MVGNLGEPNYGINTIAEMSVKNSEMLMDAAVLKLRKESSEIWLLEKNIRIWPD